MECLAFNDLSSMSRLEGGEAIAGKLIAYPCDNSYPWLDNYFTDGARVYYECKIFAYIKDKRLFFPLSDADPHTFTVLNDDWGKDARRVYFREKLVLGADPHSFQAMYFSYGLDRNAAYWRGKAVTCADSATFTTLDNGYARDAQSLFYQGRTMSGACAASFVSSGWGYAKDCDRVYSQGQPLVEPRFDPATFVALSESYIKDCNSVYWHDEPVSGADPQSFTALTDYYAKDKNSVYLHGRPFAQVDPHTFQIVQEYWRSKDDARHVTYVSECWYSKDARCVYYYRTQLDGADPLTFTPLSDGYAKDKHRVYFNDEAIAGADAATFTVLNKFYSKDAYRVYYNRLAKRILFPFYYIDEEIAVDPTQIIGEDGDLRYLKSTLPDFYTVLERVDPRTFQPPRDSYARDRHGRYLLLRGD